MKPIKVLHISSNGGVGGREKILHSLLLKGKGDVQIMQSLYLKNPEGVNYRLILTEGIDVYSATKQNVLTNFLYHVRLFENFNVLVFHFVDWYLFLAAALSGTRMIYVLSGIYLLTKKTAYDVVGIYINKIRSFFLNNIHTKPTEDLLAAIHSADTAVPNRKSFFRLLKRWFFILSVRILFYKVVVNSRYAYSSAIINYKIPHSKLMLIYNGSDEPSISKSAGEIRRELAIQPDEFVIGTVCRYDRRKRIDRLLEGFRSLDAKSCFKLLIVGGGDELLEKEFKQYVNECGLISKVIFTGLRTEVGNLINSMDLFVLPSDNESFGLALVEAMLLKKTTVVFKDSGGPAEIIGKNSFGYIIDHPARLRDICLNLQDNPDLKEKMGRDAYRYVRDHFSTQKMYCEFRKLYLYDYLV